MLFLPYRVVSNACMEYTHAGFYRSRPLIGQREKRDTRRDTLRHAGETMRQQQFEK